MANRRTGHLGATAVRHKGIEKAAVRYAVHWLEMLGYRQFVMHTDGETNIIDFAWAVTK